MNPTADYTLTIIVPVYNEQEGLPALEERLSAYLPKCPVNACVLLVNDGSTDGSAARILEACSRHTDFFYLEFDRNHGLSTALKAGFDAAESELCGYIDADLQTAPEDFDLLLPLIQDNDMVTGIRTGRKDTAWKRFQSRFANGWRRMFTHDGALDTGCPLKVLRTEMARRRWSCSRADATPRSPCATSRARRGSRNTIFGTAFGGLSPIVLPISG